MAYRFTLSNAESRNIINPRKRADARFLASLTNGSEQREYEEKRLSATMNVLDSEFSGLISERDSISEEIRDNRAGDFSMSYHERLMEKKYRINDELKSYNDIRSQVYFARMDVEDGAGDYNSYYIGKRGVDYLEVVDWRAPMGQEYYQKSERSFLINGYSYDVILRRGLNVQEENLLGMRDEFVSVKVSSAARSAYDAYTAPDRPKPAPVCRPEPAAARSEQKPAAPKPEQKPAAARPEPKPKESAVFDPYLRDILKSRKEKDRITDIIETIQEEQIKIISLPEESEFVVQGVAGSGKTMILLHRLSRLMFSNRQILPSNVLVVTPSDSFNSFIDDLSEILELDKVKTSTLSAYYESMLKSVGIDFSGKFDRDSVIPVEYLGYVYSDGFASDVEKRVRALYDSLYGETVGSKDGALAAVEDAAERLVNEYSHMKNASVRIRSRVLGEVSTDGDGNRTYTKRLREVLDSLNDVVDFLHVASDDRMRNVSFFLANMCFFAKALETICSGGVLACDSALDGLDALSNEVRSEDKRASGIFSVFSGGTGERKAQSERLLGEIEREKARIESVKSRISAICDVTAALRGTDDFKAVSKCGDIRGVTLMLYEEIVAAKKAGYGIGTKKYTASDRFALCLILARLAYSPSVMYSFFFIDEGQDISASEYAVLKALNPKAKFNVFGDLMQNVTPWRGIRDWKEIGYRQYTINVNYRNTNEIVRFVAENLGIDMTPVGLDGGAVRSVEPSGTEGFLSGKKGLRAVICSQNQIEKFRDKNYNVLSETGKLAKDRINLMTVYESKGLEFTAVAVADDDMTVNEKYIAYTRALQSLAVTKCGMEDEKPEKESAGGKSREEEPPAKEESGSAVSAGRYNASVPDEIQGTTSEEEEDNAVLTDEGLRLRLVDGGYAVTGVRECTVDDVVIPAAYNEIPVTKIADGAFSGLKSMKSLVIPGSVVSVGESAFSGCYSLSEVTIGFGVTTIGALAFSGCFSLTSVTVPGSVTSIGPATFSGCSSLKSMTVPFVGGNVAEMPASSMTTFGYIFGQTPYSGGRYAMQWYSAERGKPYYVPSSLKSVTVTGGDLPFGSFSGCGHIETISVPDTLTAINGYAFHDCVSLRDFSIPSAVKTIGDYSLCGCTSLKEVAIPSGTESIGSNAFRGCSSLEAVNIPGSVNFIGKFAFSGCKSLTDLTVAGKPAGICDSAFRECESLENVTIPEGVKTLESFAFYGCKSLESAVLPHSTEKIGAYAFDLCPGLEAVYYSGTEDEWSGIRTETYALSHVAVYFYSEEEPSGTGRFWRRVDGVPAPWRKI